MFTIQRRFGVVLALAVLLGAGSAARAAFIFTAQQRFVTGQLGGNLGGAGPQTLTAADFGVFDAATNLTVPTYGGSANQHQRSELSPDFISVIGDSSCSRPVEVGTGFADTRSFTSVSFDLADPTDVTLSASGVAYSSGGIPIHQIQLTGPGPTTLVNWTASNSGTLFPQGSGSRSTTLTLLPGSYQFKVDMQSHEDYYAINNHSVPNFNVALAIPEPTSLGAAGLIALAALMARQSRGRQRGHSSSSPAGMNQECSL